MTPIHPAPKAESPTAPTYFISLQYARAVAALLVVFSHISGFSIANSLALPHLGTMGVDLFFVISGFVMWETARNSEPLDFFARRIVRVVPAYWFYTTILVALVVLAPTLTPNVQFTSLQLLKSYFFIPYANFQGNNNPILLQGWTLNYEMYFYLIFGSSLLLPSAGWRFGFVSLVLALPALGSLLHSSDSALLALLTSPMLLEFAFGMVISAIHRAFTLNIWVAAAITAASAVLLIAIDILLQPEVSRALSFGLPCSFALLGLVKLESSLHSRPSKTMLNLGAASYSLYLSHPFVLSGVAYIFKKIQFGDPNLMQSKVTGVAFVIISGVSACIAAWASFKYVERPAGNFLARFVRLSKPIQLQRS